MFIANILFVTLTYNPKYYYKPECSHIIKWNKNINKYENIPYIPVCDMV